MLKRLNDLESKVGEMEKTKPKVDEDLFRVMESAVHDNPAVADARTRMADEKSRVILDLCMQDAGYRQAYEDYKAAVNREYVNAREKKDEYGRA